MVSRQIAEDVGVLGATSLVGESLLVLLKKSTVHTTAFTRRLVVPHDDEICWQQLSPTSLFPPSKVEGRVIPFWICAAPIWILPDYFDFLIAHRVRRIVVLSSTSRFTKKDSADDSEQAIARRLADAEDQLRLWAESHGVEWVILRPTLIYGFGRDKNISEMSRFIGRFAFFPVFGSAEGLRQPVHVADLAEACLLALSTNAAANHFYNISGGEILTYREMIRRIFLALDRKPRLITVPLWIFNMALCLLKRIPRYQKWSIRMVERMNQDMIFDHSEAVKDLGFSPRRFLPLDN